MKPRPLALAALFLAAAALLFAGCAGFGSGDEQDIRTLLNTSGYTNEDNDRSYGSDDSTVTPGGDGPLTDDPHRVPFVRFRRYIPPRGVSRQVTVDIPAYPGWPDTTALATITTDIRGELRTMFDTTSNPILVWRKPFEDRAVRKVLLFKHENRWWIDKVTPLEFSTQDAAYDLEITGLKVHASSWAAGDTFRLTSTDTMLGKHDLPCFVPSDTVRVWVTAASNGDSCWTFLHHGRPKWPHRWRKPYLKLDTYEFHGVWLIGDEGYEKAAIRPSGHDVIGWNSLWADSSAPYVSAAWGLPYVVKLPAEEIPEE
ncbi:hypothetical protein JXB37_06255 [candidate division WOR-3 bacterium]|nr:hypothetical protein [candidate division WOR-3 bacterium]